MEIDTAIAVLERHADFRLLRRLRLPEQFSLLTSEEELQAIILDTETTGLVSEIDEVIELAMIKVTFRRDGTLGRVVDQFHSFRQPASPLSETVVRLTGLTDQMLVGHTISPVEVSDFIGGAAIVIAHNAAFDRPFCERIVPSFSNYAWACSATEIPWQEEGLIGTRLQYVLTEFGYFYDAHRAMDDCMALAMCLTFRLPRRDATALSVLLENARRVDARVFAEGARFEDRLTLKKRGYRWNDGLNGYPRAWWHDVDPAALDGELNWLAELDVSIQARVYRMTAKDRFRREF